MKTLLLTTGVLALAGLLAPCANAALVFAKTIQGDALCAKSGLNETEDCQTVIHVGDGTRLAAYYAAPNRLERDFHMQICGATAPVIATGTVRQQDGQRHISLLDIAVTQAETPGTVTR